MPTERQLWKWLGDRLPPGHFSRVESETSQGFPDVNYCIQGVEGNIELKVARKPRARFPFRRGGLRDSQIRWINERLQQYGEDHNGRVWIIAQVGAERFLIHGCYAELFNQWSLHLLRRFATYRFSNSSHIKKHLRDLLCD